MQGVPAVTSFPPWLDRATLEWAADYCHQMAIRLADEDRRAPATVGADVCARGLRNARVEVEAQQRGALMSRFLRMRDARMTAETPIIDEAVRAAVACVPQDRLTAIAETVRICIAGAAPAALRAAVPFSSSDCFKLAHYNRLMRELYPERFRA
jgi:hypothetical protein